MTLPSQYYEENLYPLQDGVLKTISACETRFYLTGGTALSRAYYNHRYSDDLDFFVNNDPDYITQVNLILEALKRDGFVPDETSKFIQRDSFTSLCVKHSDWNCALKLDFVNDIVAHFGKITSTKLFCRTDSVQNILSNKVTALYRCDAKDVVDIRVIALNYSFNWTDIIREASEKEGGLELPMLAQIMKGLPQDRFDAVKWTQKPLWSDFQQDVDKIVSDLLLGQGNTIYQLCL